LLEGDITGVRDAYLDTIRALRARELTTREVSSRVRLTKTPQEYQEVRDTRRELTYEAMLASGRASWSVGARVRVYRTKNGQGGVVPERDEEDDAQSGARVDPRDYDVDHYVRLLRDTFTARLVRAFTPDDFAVVFADPDQLTLFNPSIATIRSVLTPTEPTPSAPSATS
jgi:hypothetical protein